MPHFKDNQNNLHFLDDVAYAHLLPADCVQITDEEAEALRPQPHPNLAIYAQIAQLEATITQRRLREALLTGDTTFIDSVETQIATLRSQLVGE